MARIAKFQSVANDGGRVHEAVTCGYKIFQADGETYVQLDTYGSADRQDQWKVSQSLQLDRVNAATLVALLRRAFPDLT